MNYANREATRRAIRTIIEKSEDKLVTGEKNGGINTRLDA